MCGAKFTYMWLFFNMYVPIYFTNKSPHVSDITYILRSSLQNFLPSFSLETPSGKFNFSFKCLFLV